MEDIVLQGQLVGDTAAIEGSGRLSGMCHQRQMVLLVADYFARSGGTVKLRLHVPAKSEIRDLLTGRLVSEIPAGDRTLELPLDGAMGRLLHLRPIP